MGNYDTTYEGVLKKFLDHQTTDKKIRKMTEEESALSGELWNLKKAMNACLLEMIFVEQTIYRLKISELFGAVRNFKRINYSLRRQRDLVSAASAEFAYRKPDEKELVAIKKMIQAIQKRIDYINAYPIPENIKLTPIWDYMELTGAKDFQTLIRANFPTRNDVYESQRNGKMEEFIVKMMDDLENAGKAEAYKERLLKYNNWIKEMKEKDKAEKEAEYKAIAVSESTNGIDLFQELFYKGIRTLEGSARIGLSQFAILHHLRQGNRGKYCIINCRYRRGNLSFGYALNSGKISSSFLNAAVWENRDDAQKVLTSYRDAYPDQAFMYVVI